ncbi:NVEALA domain-containing protein [Bacteroides bouchesdurhonensis]
MKKKFLLVVLAVTVVSAVCVKKSMKGVCLTDLGLENVEALAADNEGTSVGTCYLEESTSPDRDHKLFCDGRTDNGTIYPCPQSASYGPYLENSRDRCTR